MKLSLPKAPLSDPFAFPFASAEASLPITHLRPGKDQPSHCVPHAKDGPLQPHQQPIWHPRPPGRPDGPLGVKGAPCREAGSSAHDAGVRQEDCAIGQKPVDCPDGLPDADFIPSTYRTWPLPVVSASPFCQGMSMWLGWAAFAQSLWLI